MDSPVTIQLDEQGAGDASARTQSGPTWSFRTGGGGGMIFGGSGAPSNSLGANGDFYIDLDTEDLYGPKTLGAWGSPIAFTGATQFIELTDVPPSYAGEGGKTVSVKMDESGLEFTTGGAGSGDVVGPASAIDSDFVQFDTTTGKLIKDGGLSRDTDGTLAANSDSRIPSQKAVKTYADTKSLKAPAPTANDIAAVDAGGNVIDSGKIFDIDGTLAADSDARVATQKAVKTYVDQIVAATDAMVFKGVIDCSGNPNYPAADRGWTWRVSVAGKIGGASGINVEAGDLLICLDDGTPSGDQATVGSHWTIAQTNLDGAVVGPASAVDSDFVQFDTTTGKLIKDGGLARDTDGTLAANSDSKIPSQKAVKTYVDARIDDTPYDATTWDGDTAHAPSKNAVRDKFESLPAGVSGSKSNFTFGIKRAAGVVTGKLAGYWTCPFAGTISAWNLTVDAGTITIKIWKIATGTAHPTSADSINTSGIALSAGTHLHSTDLSDFTTTAVAAGDTFVCEITAVSGVSDFGGSIEITKT